MSSLVVGNNAIKVTAGASIASILTADNALIAYEIGADNYPSWKPNRLSAISNFEVGKSYLINAKQPIDVSAIAADVTAEGALLVYNNLPVTVNVKFTNGFNQQVGSIVQVAANTDYEIKKSELPAGATRCFFSATSFAKVNTLTTDNTGQNTYNDENNIDLNNSYVFDLANVIANSIVRFLIEKVPTSDPYLVISNTTNNDVTITYMDVNQTSLNTEVLTATTTKKQKISALPAGTADISFTSPADMGVMKQTFADKASSNDDKFAFNPQAGKMYFDVIQDSVSPAANISYSIINQA